MKTVTLCMGGQELVVNPLMVGAIQPADESPKSRTYMTIFGRVFKVRGNVEYIKRALGWSEDSPRFGFPEDLPDPAMVPESTPPASVSTAVPLEESVEPYQPDGPEEL